MIYKGNKLKEIVFPLGGIGTGSIGLAGNGSFVDWEIFNRPSKGSLNGHTHFAIRAEYPDGKSITKILQGVLTNTPIQSIVSNIIDGYSEENTHEENANSILMLLISNTTLSEEECKVITDIIMKAFLNK